MDNIGGATPPLYTTSDSPSCITEDVLPIIIILLILIIFFIIPFMIQKKHKETVDEKEQLNKLKEYKKLLDEGIITQEDYEEKKKQILNL